jgi:hypothetical protein
MLVIPLQKGTFSSLVVDLEETRTLKTYNMHRMQAMLVMPLEVYDVESDKDISVTGLALEVSFVALLLLFCFSELRTRGQNTLKKRTGARLHRSRLPSRVRQRDRWQKAMAETDVEGINGRVSQTRSSVRTLSASDPNPLHCQWREIVDLKDLRPQRPPVTSAKPSYSSGSRFYADIVARRYPLGSQSRSFTTISRTHRDVWSENIHSGSISN